MTEDQARQVVLVLARESAPADAAVPWSAADRAWATRQALATVGESATPDAFVTARAALALGRLLPRDSGARQFLSRRLWHPAWVLAALVLGLATGLLVDQLGPPQQVNLLAPAVWLVVAWNLAVYALLLLPRGGSSWPARLAPWWEGRMQGAAALWARHAAPLTAQRLLQLVHAAAAALGLGLMAGLYLRGLVLDYRVGWQSTFLEAGTVQALLNTLLAPAAAVTGIGVADVAPLQVGPGAAATARAAPWIHLYAATLALFVVLPRLVLASWAGGRAQRLAAHFPLPLDLPGLRSLHPLMRPGPPQPLRLLWAADASVGPCVLMGQAVHAPQQAQALWQAPEGDALELLPLPAEWTAATRLPTPRRWWQTLLHPADPRRQQLRQWQQTVDVVLRVAAPDTPPLPWLAELGRPVLQLHDAARAEPPALPLRALADGWLADGALLQALQAALPDDARVARVLHAWQAAQAQRLDEAMALIAQALARAAVARERVPDEGLVGRKDDGAAARDRLARQFEADLAQTVQALAVQVGSAAQPAEPAELQAQATVHGRVGEGRAAVLGGVLSGALAGLKADLLSGGLTLGAGAVAGGVLGALGAAGAARGLNAVRGTEHSHAAWGDEAAPALAQALLLPYLQLAHGLPRAAAQAALQTALAAHGPALRQAWQARPDADAVARASGPVLVRLVRQALGGP